MELGNWDSNDEIIDEQTLLPVGAADQATLYISWRPDMDCPGSRCYIAQMSLTGKVFLYIFRQIGSMSKLRILYII